MALGTVSNSYALSEEMQMVGKLMALTYYKPNAVATSDILHMVARGGEWQTVKYKEKRQNLRPRVRN